MSEVPLYRETCGEADGEIGCGERQEPRHTQMSILMHRVRPPKRNAYQVQR
jgi:hypothetical protein